MKTSKRESIAQKKSFLSAALELAEYTVEHLDSDGEGSSEESALEMDMNSDSDAGVGTYLPHQPRLLIY